MLRCLLGAVALAMLLSACGGGGGSGPATSPPPAVRIDYAVDARAVIKVRAADSGDVASLEEKLLPLTSSGPDRTLTLLDSTGAVVARYTAPAGFALIDFARHASGEISVALATAKTLRLVRLDARGTTLSELAFADAQAATDPFYDQGGVHDDTSLLPIGTRDAVRLAPAGESVIMALRTGRNAVVAYRLDYSPAGGYTRAWRTLVEPGVSMFIVGITSGTFDTFGQLENHWHVALDTDAAGGAAIAVTGNPGFAPIFPAHADFFREPTTVTTGVLVTRLGPGGERIGATPIDTVRISELHGVRASVDDVALVGRVFTEQRADGSGWDAYAAHVSRVSGVLVAYRVIDVDAGDVLFDIVPAGQGRYLAAGATGYTQNPTGASISENSAPLLVLLESDGTVRQRVPVTAGARQNQLRSVVPRGSEWLLGGMVNGPGTHSGDGNPALITANGFVRQVAVALP